MLTIKQHLETLPQPYRDEALKRAFPTLLNKEKAYTSEAIMTGINWGKANSRQFKMWQDLFKEYKTLEWEMSKAIPSPEPRPEMAMPKHSSCMGPYSAPDDYSCTNSDKFTEQFQGFKDGTINHSEYYN